MDCSAPEVLSGGVGAHSDSNDGGVGCCNTDVNDSDKKILFLRLLWSMAAFRADDPGRRPGARTGRGTSELRRQHVEADDVSAGIDRVAN